MKRRVWRWVLVGVVAIVAIAAVILWDLKRKAAAVVARHEKAAAAKLAEIRARSWSREPLFGTELPGNRWDTFAAALDALDLIPDDELDEIPECRGEPNLKGDPEKLDEIFAKHRASVDLLRESCRRRTLIPPYAYEEGFAMNLPYITKAMKVDRYLAGDARRLHDLGRDAEALDRVTLALAMAQDSAFGGPVINHLVMKVCEHRAHEAARTVLGNHSLTSSELDALAVRVERLWEARPRFSEALEVEEVTARLGLRRPADLSLLMPARSGRTLPSRWRYLYSWDLMLPEALNEFEAFYRDAAALDGVPWPERLSRAKILMERAENSHNPIVSVILPSMSRCFKGEAIAQMRWSLLRTSLALARHEAAHGKLPEKLEELVPKYLPRLPECPFSGRPLGYANGQIWSFGGDGDDDGGRPPPDEDIEESDGDVVWTVKRK